MQDNDKQADQTRPEHEIATLGARLKATREDLDLSIEQLAGELRIELRLLLALENDRLEELGAPVFAKGYLKQYGNRLGLDYGDLLAQYYRQADHGQPEPVIVPSRPIRLMDNRQIYLWIIAGLTVLLLAVLLAIWWLNAPDGESVGIVGPPADEPAPFGPAPPDSGSQTGEPALFEPAPPEAEPQPPSTAQDAVGAAPAPGLPTTVPEAPPTPPDEAPAAAVGQPSAPDAAPGQGIEIVMLFEQDSWVEAVDAGGERLFYGLAEQGTQARFSAVPPVSFLLGNAGGVQMLVDGEPYPVPAGSRQGNLARFSISD